MANRRGSGVRHANGLMRSDICEEEMRKQDWTRSLRPAHRADKRLPVYQELWSKDEEKPQVPENGKPLSHCLTQALAGDHNEKRMTMAGNMKALTAETAR